MSFCEVIRVRIFVRRVAAALPFVKISEAVLVGVLIENAGVFDRQTVFFEPIIRNRSMYLRVLQRGRKTVRADEMFLRNKKPRTGAGFPLRRLLELLRCAIEFDCDRRLRGSFRARRVRREKAVPEPARAPPNA